MKIGLIGTGMVGSIHARAASHAGARLVGVSSRTAAGAEEAAARLGFDKAFADPMDLIADDSIDLIHICTPNNLHEPLAEAAIAAGHHVICEKPLAMDAAGAEVLSAAAGSAGLVAAVPFVYRFYPMIREARARVRRGDLGSLSVINGVYLQDWLLTGESSNWRIDPALGGPSRAFADIGSHWCDLIEFVTGERLAAVSAQMRTVHEHRPRPAAGVPTFIESGGQASGDTTEVETEDLAVVAFRTSSGIPGAVVVSQVSPGAKNRLTFEITGSEAAFGFRQETPETLTVDDADGRIQVNRDPARLLPEAARYATLPVGHPQGFNDCFDAFVADVYRRVESGAGVDGLPTFEDGARAAQITDAVLRSAHSESCWMEIGVPETTTYAERNTK